jgi:alpha-aminoadipate carrier protein LysW
MSVTTCPECGSDVDVEQNVLPSEIVLCGECRTELEVLARDPVLLALAPEPEEDWGE